MRMSVVMAAVLAAGLATPMLAKDTGGWAAEGARDRAPQAGRVFDRMDTNGDGVVSREEFQAGVRAKQEARQAERQARQQERAQRQDVRREDRKADRRDRLGVQEGQEIHKDRGGQSREERQATKERKKAEKAERKAEKKARKAEERRGRGEGERRGRHEAE